MLAWIGTYGIKDGVWYISKKPKTMMALACNKCTGNGGKKRKTGRLTNGTLIHVLVASTAYEASGTGANGTTIKRVGVTHGAFIARVTDTGIIQVAQQTCGEIKIKAIGEKISNQSNHTKNKFKVQFQSLIMGFLRASVLHIATETRGLQPLSP